MLKATQPQPHQKPRPKPQIVRKGLTILMKVTLRIVLTLKNFIPNYPKNFAGYQKRFFHQLTAYKWIANLTAIEFLLIGIIGEVGWRSLPLAFLTATSPRLLANSMRKTFRCLLAPLVLTSNSFMVLNKDILTRLPNFCERGNVWQLAQ